MTKQTKEAIDLTIATFNDNKFHSESEWNDKIRKANFNPTLKTILKYVDHEKSYIKQAWYAEDTLLFKLK